MVTIKDVAKRARVGVSTVSRVFNEHPDVGNDTRDKVLRIAKQLGYRPHSRARQLVRDTTETICFILSNREVMSPFHSRVLVGVEEYARNVSHSVIFMRYDYSAHSSPDELVLPRVIWERGTVDGVIIAGTNYPNFVQAVQALRIPCVLFGNNLIGRVPIEEIDTIWYDTEAAAREATDYLIGLGHAKISFAGDTNLPWYRRLHRGYAAALDQRGLPRHELNPEVHSSLFDYGMSCASEIANERRRSTAVLAGDDEIALGMLAGFRRLGIRIPDDISLIGCDDIDAIQYVHPALTTIRIPKQRIGKELAVALFNRLAEPGGKPAKRVLPAELVTRESCKRPLK